jgi:uncharacterized protein
MPLKVNLRHLEDHGVRLKGELPVAEMDFGLNDELIRLEKPLVHDLTVEQLHDSLLVQGSLKLVLDCECVRCLKAFKHKLVIEGYALHLPLEGEDKVSIDNDCVDLTPFLREDMLLEFPQHPLCKPDCAGIKLKKKAEPDAVADKDAPSPWGELDKLKL